MQVKSTALWKVTYTEYERGWGQKKFAEPKLFTTAKEAYEEERRFNSQNTAKETPEWYVVANVTRVS